MPVELAFNSEQLEFFRALEVLRKPPGFVTAYLEGERQSIEDRGDALRAASAQEGQGVVHTVALCGGMPQSAKLEALGALEQVYCLWCERWEWAEAITRLRRPELLGTLVVRNQAIGAEAACLATCSGLVQLDLWHCRLGPGALTALEGCENLKTLKLAGCTLDDEAKRVVRSLRRLNHLGLTCTNMTDADFAEWELPPTLTSVFLCETAIGDAAVEQLAKAPTLQSLILGDTQVTEACLSSLAALPALAELSVARTGISEERLATFLEEHSGVEHYDMRAIKE